MFSFILSNEIQMFSQILMLWHYNEHGLIDGAMEQWTKLVSLNLKFAGSNPLTDEYFHMMY